MALYDIISGNTAAASDVEQLVQIFNGKHDIGAVTLAPQISAPSSGSFSLASQSGSSLGVGVYNYQFTYVTGQYKSDGTTLVQTGETTPSAALSITTTSGNTTVLVTLPTSGIPTSAIAINIYRTSVGGSDYKLVATVKTGSTNYSDSVADASRGSQTPPGSNTTGTTINPGVRFGFLTPITNFYSSMTNGWVVFGGSPTYQYPCYWQDANGIVRLSGAMKSGSNGQFFTMPAGLRPGNQLGFNVSCGASGSGSTGRITVTGAGSLSVTATDNSFVSLDGVFWLAQQ